jgi:Flp pilus assembly protein TadB
LASPVREASAHAQYSRGELETRSECDREKLACQRINLGSIQGPVLMALEPRLKAGVLLWGGLVYLAAPEVHLLNLALRCTVPTLRVNVRFERRLPLETSQLPTYGLLSAADTDHYLLDAGHVAFNQDVIRSVFGWLDTYLGPVSTR